MRYGYNCTLYSCKCCSSQSTDSASRWLVGSSSNNISGFCNNKRHNATLLFSPPERFLTVIASSGGSEAHPLPFVIYQIPGIMLLNQIVQASLLFNQLIHFIISHWLARICCSPLRILSKYWCLLCCAFTHYFNNCFIRIKLRLLFQVTNFITGRKVYFTIVRLFNSCNNL